MAEFCECGSLIIDGRCSNKSCTLRANTAAPVKKAPKAKASGTGTVSKASAPKKSDPRRASKVITYNLYDKNNDEGPEI